MSPGTVPRRSRASSQTRRSKDWGREVENQTLRVLKGLGFTRMRRTGSVAYSKAAADLVQDRLGVAPTIHIVATKDKGPGNKVLLTMSGEDLDDVLRHVGSRAAVGVRVQCKGRASTWIGRLWRELKEAGHV